MCGRFSNRFSRKELEALYRGFVDWEQPEPGSEAWEKWDGNVNIAPTTMVPVLRYADVRRRMDLMRWGFIAPWTKTMKEAAKYSMWNVKGEEILTKSWSNAWSAGRRCIIPAESFFEWKKLDQSKRPQKQPYAIGLGNRQPMAFAALWQDCINHDTGEVVTCCSILTIRANRLMAAIHDRMPVIIGDEDQAAWLGETPTTHDNLLGMLKPFPPERMKAWPVSKAVGNVKNSGAKLLEEIRPETAPLTLGLFHDEHAAGGQAHEPIAGATHDVVE